MLCAIEMNMILCHEHFSSKTWYLVLHCLFVCKYGNTCMHNALAIQSRKSICFVIYYLSSCSKSYHRSGIILQMFDLTTSLSDFFNQPISEKEFDKQYTLALHTLGVL